MGLDAGGWCVRVSCSSCDLRYLYLLVPCFLQVYCDNDFAFLPRLAPYLPLDRPVSVLDAGTNVGLAAILFAQLIKFRGEVVAVDANPGTLAVRPRRVRNGARRECVTIVFAVTVAVGECVHRACCAERGTERLRRLPWAVPGRARTLAGRPRRSVVL